MQCTVGKYAHAHSPPPAPTHFILHLPLPPPLHSLSIPLRPALAPWKLAGWHVPSGNLRLSTGSYVKGKNFWCEIMKTRVVTASWSGPIIQSVIHRVKIYQAGSFSRWFSLPFSPIFSPASQTAKFMDHGVVLGWSISLTKQLNLMTVYNNLQRHVYKMQYI